MTAIRLPLASGLWLWDWDQEIGADRMAAVPALRANVQKWLTDKNMRFNLSLERDPEVTAFVDLDVLCIHFEGAGDATAFKDAWLTN
jgi:hypothetical protein